MVRRVRCERGGRWLRRSVRRGGEGAESDPVHAGKVGGIAPLIVGGEDGTGEGSKDDED